MSEKIKVSDLPNFEITEHLPDDAAIAQYLSIVLEDGDPDFLLAALGDVARARGMTQIAKDSGVTREALYRALSAGARPRFETIQKVLTALGVKLVAQPL
jgi:probable addiction module antidote protein